MKLSILSAVATLVAGAMGNATIWFYDDGNCGGTAFIADTLPSTGQCFNFDQPHHPNAARLVACDSGRCRCIIFPVSNCGGSTSTQVEVENGISLECNNISRFPNGIQSAFCVEVPE